jgi:hypothetical protein
MPVRGYYGARLRRRYAAEIVTTRYDARLKRLTGPGTSLQIITTTNDRAILSTEEIVVTGSRMWMGIGDGTSSLAVYSDDGGLTWTPTTFTSAGTSVFSVHAYLNGGTWNLIGVQSSSQGSTGGSLIVGSITSNVASGTPGAWTALTVDAGGTNLGVSEHTACVSATATNPRVWVVARKATAASTIETRAWYCTAADVLTLGNWSSANFVNMGASSGADVNKCGKAVWWTVSGVDKLTMIIHKTQGLTSQTYNTYTFDPTAGTPTPGAATALTMQDTLACPSNVTQGHLFDAAAQADYLVFGTVRNSGASSGVWDWFKTVDGTTWSNPSGWTGITAGQATVASDGANFYLAHNNAFGASSSTASALFTRIITASGDTMGSAVAFSDSPGTQLYSGVAGGYLNVVYRGGTASPYPILFDRLNITGTATNAAAECATAVAAAQDVASSAGANAESPTAAAEAQDPATSVDTPAECAAATAAAQDPVASVGASAESPTATAAGQDASVSVQVFAECATATASALDATVSTGNASPQAGLASATATADPFADPFADDFGTLDANVSVLANAECATVTASALDATVSTSAAVNAPAGLASVTAAAQDAVPAVAATAEAATGSATALDPAPAVSPAAEAATATASGLDPQAAVSVNAEGVTAAAAAQDPTAAVAVTAECATATAAALDPTVTTGSNVNAPAGVASATATANDPQASVAATAEAATASGQAADPTAGVGPSAETALATAAGLDMQAGTAANPAAATGTAAAFDPVTAVVVNAECATTAATALDATVTAGANVNVAAGLASATATANDAAAAIGASPGAATATASGQDASAALRVAVEAALAQAFALDAVGATGGPGTGTVDHYPGSTVDQLQRSTVEVMVR